ncbi:hypothetical protein [Cryptosporangium aurantiacum]|uniref:EcsC protein family protein n=1 Tax=Cryptosporangium aurantiacum TaxID=134849 RepID=A0A1M7J1F7_9ACTN|nr:hypothetical protein [Cryptosporangium aurantiacum]SHM46904.1 hypothetical protein SAMN05443668_101659 [Cryptosporangium aurantiacum]
MTYPDNSSTAGSASEASDPASGTPVSDPTPADVSPETTDALVRLTDAELTTADRRRLLKRVVSGLGRGAGRALRGPRAAVNWATDLVIAVAPHVVVRDLETLQRHYGGKSGEDLADALIRNASRATAGLGAAGGGVAAISWTTPPALLSAPVVVAVETAAIVAVEVKLLAELHEVYGVPIRGSASERASALLQSWSRRRGVTLLQGGRGFTTILGSGLRKDLRDRLVRRMGKNVTTLGPLFTGATVGAELNRRATRSLGDEVRADLRKGGPAPSDQPGQPGLY